jgi:GDPmannose 4,6-dehydratase
MLKKALITGITGQDGSYLAEFLLGKGYEVHGIKRRTSIISTGRIDAIYQDPHISIRHMVLHYGDLTDSLSLAKVVRDVRPDEVYNLGAQSHVAVSFENPQYSCDVDALGTLRLLEAIRQEGLCSTVRFYQASSSEMFGATGKMAQSETSPFHPRSPYGAAKAFAHWITVNYREAYGMYACNGILFNHESPRRGETFVTRKITRSLARIALGLDESLYLGNLDARRDWGHARDFVRMQWLMLQQPAPDDYVIATGKQHAVREFLAWAAEDLGLTLEFHGTGLQEIAVVAQVRGDLAPAVRVGQQVVAIDPRYIRPAEVDSLLGDASKARERLQWQPEISARALCAEMVAADYELARRELLMAGAAST